jgi:glycosyltransferase involved in cell wall biosynthesis
MKKILIITYYWPPSGGGGVQRWLKFVKYLPEFGWNPVVVAPLNPEYPVFDNSLESEIPEGLEVIKLPIWEPYGIFKNLTGRKKEERVNNGLVFDKQKQKPVEKFLLWFRGNVLIPDPRIFWVVPSVMRLKKIIQAGNFEAIVTTGPPQSIHLIGFRLKKIYNIPWIADLRDPWSTFEQLEQFYPSELAIKRQKRLERKTLSYADKIITVSSVWAAELEESTGKSVDLVSNGFDEEDVYPPSSSTHPYFTISHIGMINSYRNNNAFWEALNEVCLESEQFRNRLRIYIAGIYDECFKQELSNYQELSGKLIFSGYVPHADVKFKYDEADVLLLLQNQKPNSLGHIPGKTFEYLATGKPILALADQDSDMARIIKSCGAGFVCHPADKIKIKECLSLLFKGNVPAMDKSKIMLYSRRSVTKKLSTVLEGLVSKNL